jgi:hypothetical protein
MNRIYTTQMSEHAMYEHFSDKEHFTPIPKRNKTMFRCGIRYSQRLKDTLKEIAEKNNTLVTDIVRQMILFGLSKNIPYDDLIKYQDSGALTVIGDILMTSHTVKKHGIDKLGKNASTYLRSLIIYALRNMKE